MEQPELDLESMTNEELEQKLNPTTPAPVADKVVLPATTEEKPAPAKPAETAVLPEAGADLAVENGKLKKQLENLQQIFGRQSNELGELRKNMLAKPTAADFDTDPVKAAEQLQERQEQEKEVRALENSQATQATAIRNMQFLNQYAPDLVSNAKLIREVLEKEDKLDEGDINKFSNEIFLQNPWGVYQLNQRVKQYAQINALKAEIENLKKAPTETIARIKGINKVSSNVTAATGQAADATNSMSANSIDLADMTDDELKAHLKKSTSKG